MIRQHHWHFLFCHCHLSPGTGGMVAASAPAGWWYIRHHRWRKPRPVPGVGLKTWGPLRCELSNTSCTPALNSTDLRPDSSSLVFLEVYGSSALGPLSHKECNLNHKGLDDCRHLYSLNEWYWALWVFLIQATQNESRQNRV